VRAIGGALSVAALGARWELQGSYVRHGALAVHATPARGRFEPTIAAWKVAGRELDLRASRALSWAGGELRLAGMLRGADWRAADDDSLARDTRALRATALVRFNRERDRHALRLTAFTGAVGADGKEPLPPQSLVYLGGPVSGPGYAYHAFRSTRGAMLHAEYGVRIPFLSVPLARYGTSPANAMLLPYVHAVAIAQPASGSVPSGGVYPSIGLALEIFFDLIRIESARGLRDGRWTLSVDLSEAVRAIF